MKKNEREECICPVLEDITEVPAAPADMEVLAVPAAVITVMVVPAAL